MGLPSGTWGMIVDGIPILEKNRATVWEFRRSGIEILQQICQKNYRDKRINAIVFGIEECRETNMPGAFVETVKYAVFCESGFLINVSEDEDEDG